MFGFLRTPVPHGPSAAIAHGVEQDGLPADVTHSSMLRVVESRGRYSGRKVMFIRVFDPVRTTECAVIVQRYRDLDEFPSLVLWSGHVESDGIVALTRSAAITGSRTSTRVHADRAEHADDERFVFQGQESVVPGVTS